MIDVQQNPCATVVIFRGGGVTENSRHEDFSVWLISVNYLEGKVITIALSLFCRGKHWNSIAC